MRLFGPKVKDNDLVGIIAMLEECQKGRKADKAAADAALADKLQAMVRALRSSAVTAKKEAAKPVAAPAEQKAA